MYSDQNSLEILFLSIFLVYKLYSNKKKSFLFLVRVSVGFYVLLMHILLTKCLLQAQSDKGEEKLNILFALSLFMAIDLYITLAMNMAHISSPFLIGYCLYLDLSRGTQENTSNQFCEFSRAAPSGSPST